MRQHQGLLIFLCLALLLPVAAGAQTSGSPASAPPVQDQKSMDDVAKQFKNPVADIWSLNCQFNRHYLQGDVTDITREQDVLNFQPGPVQRHTVLRGC